MAQVQACPDVALKVQKVQEALAQATAGKETTQYQLSGHGSFNQVVGKEDAQLNLEFYVEDLDMYFRFGKPDSTSIPIDGTLEVVTNPLPGKTEVTYFHRQAGPLQLAFLGFLQSATINGLSLPFSNILGKGTGEWYNAKPI